MKEIRPIRAPWKGTMTARERFNRQMHWQSVDRCFNMEFGYWQENFTTWPLFYENGITNNAQADIFFNFDRIEVTGGKVWMCPPFEAREVGRRGNKIILINGDGLMAEVLASGRDTIPHYIKSSITTPEDWFGAQDDYKYYDGSSTKTLTYEEYKQKIKELDDGAVPVSLASMTLLEFGQVRKLPTRWLDAPTNQTVSFDAPRSHPLPRNPHLAAMHNHFAESRLTVYTWAMESYMGSGANYGRAEPAKPYYALYDLDGNGDDELFLGEKRGDVIAMTVIYYFADAASEAAAELRIEDERINGSFTVLSNGWIVCETKLNGSVSNSDRHYWGIGETVQRAELWQYGKEAALYDFSGTPSQEGKGYILPLSLKPKAYERQRAVFEAGASVVTLEWKPLEEYGK